MINLITYVLLSDIAVNNRKKPCLLQLSIKESKTNPQGVKVYVGATDNSVCPIKAILS